MIPVIRDIPLNNFSTVPVGCLEYLGLATGRSHDDAAMRNIIGQLFTESIEHHGSWISYSRRAEWWSGASYFKGSDFTLTTVSRAVERLAGMRYIEHEKAAPMPYGSGMQSRFRPAYLLFEFFSSAAMPTPTYCGPLLLMRDEWKKPIAYRRTDGSDRMLRQIEGINADIDGFSIEHPGMVFRGDSLLADIGGTVINTADRRLRRVFNDGSWSMGGRAYASAWQNIPKELRSKLLLNGQPICEPDHKNLHPRLLYARKGIVWSVTDEAYEINDWPRPIVKPAFNTMINANTEQAAHYSICRLIAGHEAAEDVQLMQLVAETHAPYMLVARRAWHRLAALFGKRARELMEAIKRRHKPVAEYFCSGIGLRLQRRDADMCLSVTRKLLDAGIPTLPVHDSHFALKQHKNQVQMIMTDAIDKLLSNGRKFAVNNMQFQALSDGRLPHSGGVVPGADAGMGGGPALPTRTGPSAHAGSAIRSVSPVEGSMSFGGAEILTFSPFRAEARRVGGLFPINYLPDLGLFTDGHLPESVRAAAIHEAKARGLTQDRLAEKIGISRPQLTNALRGRFGLGKVAAKKLREFLAC